VRLQSILDQHTSPWGVKVTMVEVKQVDLPEQMIRAIGRQAEAERERRAKIIHAEGEYSAAEKLSMAAKVIQEQPVAIQLRYLQTLVEIGTEKNTTIVFPLPLDILSSLAVPQNSASESRTPVTTSAQRPSTPDANPPVMNPDVERPDDKPAVEQAPQPTTVPAKEASAPETPAPKAKAPVAAAEPPAGTFWQVHAGSQTSADALAQTLKESGVPSHHPARPRTISRWCGWDLIPTRNPWESQEAIGRRRDDQPI
jgi:hypothetical protein